MQPPGVALAVVLGLMLVVGNALAIAGIWLAVTGHIGPDSLGGIRTNATRASEAAWRAAHRAALPVRLVGNGLALGCGVGVMFAGNTVMPFLVLVAVAVVLAALAMLGGVLVGHRAALRVERGHE